MYRLALPAALALVACVSPGAHEPRSVLPVPGAPFAGVIGETIAESTPDYPRPVSAPPGAPNLFLFMADDVGFSMSSTFGGPVPTPNMDRLAAAGVRFNRFHTTAICSPSRAALLTGRNHHAAATGHLADLPMGFPGYTARIPRSTATLAEVLKLNGFNTAMFGKHHNVPPGEQSVAGPFSLWPTGLGFEYFFGFVNGDTDQWHPVLHRGTHPVLEGQEPGRLLDARLADDVVRWVRDQQAAAPDRPFLAYLAPGSAHAPHQAPPEWIARFRGRFDHGWDRVREETWRRQLEQRVVPEGTQLTPRPDAIAAWSSLTPVQRAFAARGMEVAAAMLAYQDEQLGRILDELERMGILDETLFLIIQGDNGASGDGDLAGVVNEFGAINGLDADADDEAWLEASTARLGGERTYSSYAEGWGWAMNAPFRWYKHHASMLGGIRNGMILAWGARAMRPGSVCARFGHLVDVAPTLFEAAGVPAPREVNGAAQKPLDGQSLLDVLRECDPDRPRTQYFELGGKAGLYHDGWLLSSEKVAGEDAERWTLHDLREDYAQARDVAARHPERVERLARLWRAEAERSGVFPIREGFAAGFIRPQGERPRGIELWGNGSGVPAHPGGLLLGHGFRGSFRIRAQLRLDGAGASGVVAALGSHFAGWSLHLDAGRPVFVYARSTRPGDRTTIASERRLPAGAASLSLSFARRGSGVNGPARVELRSGESVLATGEVPMTFFIPLGVGERLDVGRDTGVAVADHPTASGALQGEVTHLELTFE